MTEPRLLGEVHRTGALRLVASRARHADEATLAAVLLYDEEADALTVEVADGAKTYSPWYQ